MLLIRIRMHECRRNAALLSWQEAERNKPRPGIEVVLALFVNHSEVGIPIISFRPNDFIGFAQLQGQVIRTACVAHTYGKERIRWQQFSLVSAV